MKILSGKFKNLNLKYGKIDCRPTLARARKMLFDTLRSLKPEVNTFLDCFGGSGIIGLEAHSNFNTEVTYIEFNKELFNNFKKNLMQINLLENFKLINKNILIIANEIKNKYDVIFLDPPYDKIYLAEKLLNKFIKNDILEEKGIIIIEQSKLNPIKKIPENFNIIKEKEIGNTKIIFLIKN